MKGKFSIALCEDVVHYQASIQHVAESMDAPLKVELDCLVSKGKLVKNDLRQA